MGARPERGGGRAPSRAPPAQTNQGLRYLQAEWLLWVEAYDELDALFATTRTTRGCLRLHEGPRCVPSQGSLRQLLEEAHEMNPHVVGYLTGRKPVPKRLPDGTAPTTS